ncbi:conserved hypothetical protein [Candidatus Accumulibacter aalborgensis]|uniref:Toxin CptA n=1 Tax=Candidatus Accumulibacter aalborgensis TaxID=1860102 RepID=A0A1A8XIY8_9PROT|nr:protein YgfX [Candidatus Accumulibacter aalborgensis]SBT04342.1 conserved hypothetical protein [Candidatus Accumulibacter aalborgensis]
MQFPLHLTLRRSRLLSFLIVWVHLLAGGCVWVLSWPAALRYGLLALLALSAWHALRRSPVVALRLTEGGELAFLSAAGDRVLVSVKPETVVFSQLIVLRARDDDQGRLMTLVLLTDSMSAEQFRQLRLWLRWRPDASEQSVGDV